jgi:predicted nucleic acid-binding protein
MRLYLIDSNVVIDYKAKRIPAENLDFISQIFEKDFHISVAVEIEVLGFNTNPEATAEMEEFIAGATIFQLDESVTRRTIELRRRYKLKLGDAIIAATALEYNLTLITHNIADFKRIDGLTLLNPYDPIAPETSEAKN